MAEDNENKLTSLMKEKYGVTKSSPVKFTEKDNLYTEFRKIADNIYKNGDWSEQDYINAVETLINNREGLEIGGNDPSTVKINVHPTTAEERLELGDSRIQGMLPYTAEIIKQKEGQSPSKRIRYMILDPNNQSTSKQNKHWWLPNAEKKTFGYNNINRAIGYDKLQRDLMKEFFAHEDELAAQGIKPYDIQKKLEQLTNINYSGKKWDGLFSPSYFGNLTDEYLNTALRDERPQYWGVPEERNALAKSFNWRDLTLYPNNENKLNLDEAPYLIPIDGQVLSVSPGRIKKDRHNNDVINFIHGYLENTYDVILQQEYNKSINKLTRASAWQTKKNINQETQQMMDNTSLKENFKFIELDNDVDLNLFHDFEKEMKRVHEILPKVDAVPDLRLRKLGNYHALGLYEANSKTIAIDFRSSGDVKQKGTEYAPNGIGVQSFIHEYGHFLDYNVREDGQLLSMTTNFKPLVTRYRQNIEKLPDKSIVKLKNDYYGTPTEVFARAFEIYSSNAGLESSFIKSKENYVTNDDYICFDEVMRQEINDYFDHEFPEYKKQIKSLKEKKKVEQEKTQEVIPEIPSTNKEQINRVKEKNNEESKAVSKKKTFTEMKAYAKSRNILEVADAIGMELFKAGNTYKWTEHDSLTIFPNSNTYKWFSQDKQGDSISLVENVKKLDFKSAVAFLNDINLQGIDPTLLNQSKEPFKYLFKDHKSFDEGRKYLKEKRGLSDDTINYFIKRGDIVEATRYHKGGKSEPVIVFKQFTPDGELVGATLQGIEENRELYPKRGYLKEIVKNSDGNYGLSVDVGQPKKLVFFESSIDLMSYYEIKSKNGELENSRLVSMDGLKETTISNYFRDTYFPNTPVAEKNNSLFIAEMNDYLNKYENPLETLKQQGIEIILAVDNDKPGREFIEKFKDYKNLPINSELSPTGKDWNDYLKEEKANQSKKKESPKDSQEADGTFSFFTDKNSKAVRTPDAENSNLSVSSNNNYSMKSVKNAPNKEMELISLRDLVTLIDDKIGGAIYEEDYETGNPTFPASTETLIGMFRNYPENEPMTQEMLNEINESRFFDAGSSLQSLKEVLELTGYTTIATNLKDIDIDALYDRKDYIPINKRSHDREGSNIGTKKERHGLGAQQAEFDELNLFTNNIVGWKVPTNLGASSALILPQQYSNYSTNSTDYHLLGDGDESIRKRFSTLYDSAIDFKEKLADKDWTIISTFGEGSFSLNTVNVRADQFGHLVGLKYKPNGSKTPQLDLFNDLVNRKVDENRLLIQDNGNTIKKISVFRDFIADLSTETKFIPNTMDFKENLKMNKALYRPIDGIMEGFRLAENQSLNWVTNLSIRGKDKKETENLVNADVLAMMTTKNGNDPKILMLNKDIPGVGETVLKAASVLDAQRFLINEESNKAKVLQKFINIPITQEETVGEVILKNNIKLDLNGLSSDDISGLGRAFLKGSREAGITEYSKIDSFIEELAKIGNPEEIHEKAINNFPPDVAKSVQKKEPEKGKGEISKDQLDFDYQKAKPEELSKQALEKIRSYTENPEDFIKYLNFMSKFPNLSPRNVALIQEQWEGANAVATFKQWQGLNDKLGLDPEDIIQSKRIFTNKKTGKSEEVTLKTLSVKAGEHSEITLFRPCIDEIIPVLDKAGKPEVNDQGKTVYKNIKNATKEEKQLLVEGKIQKRTIQSRDKNGKPLYATYKVFELSQTNLNPDAYPKAMPNRHYNFDTDKVKCAEVTMGLKKYAEDIQVPILMDDSNFLGNAKGAYFPTDQKILLNSHNTPGENLATSIHELAHATLHNPRFAAKNNLPTSQKELEAEMTSLIVSKRFGLDTSEKAIPYISKWTKNLNTLSDEELNKSMIRVHRVSGQLINTIEHFTKPYSQNKNQNLNPDRPKQNGLNRKR